MSITLTFGWWLVPAFATPCLVVLAIVIAEKLGGGGDGTGLVLFPAVAVALVLIAAAWGVYLWVPGVPHP